MWNLKCTIIPVITGATGIVTRSLRKNLEVIPGKHSIDSLQKTAILGTSHIIRKVLQCETWSLSGGNHCWFKRSTRKKRPVTRDDNTNNNNNLFSVWGFRNGKQILHCFMQSLHLNKSLGKHWITKGKNSLALVIRGHREGIWLINN